MWKQWNNILSPLKEQTSVVFKAILWQKYLKYRHKLYNCSCFPTCVLFHCTKGETFLSEARGEKLMNALTSFERSAPRSTISVGSLSLLKEWSWSWGGMFVTERKEQEEGFADRIAAQWHQLRKMCVWNWESMCGIRGKMANGKELPLCSFYRELKRTRMCARRVIPAGCLFL